MRGWRARRRAHGSRRATAGTSPPGVVRGRRLWLPGEALIELEGGLGHRIGGGIVLGAGGPPTVAGRGRVRSAAVCERLCVRQTSTIGILSFATRALGTLRGVRYGRRLRLASPGYVKQNLPPLALSWHAFLPDTAPSIFCEGELWGTKNTASSACFCFKSPPCRRPRGGSEEPFL